MTKKSIVDLEHPEYGIISDQMVKWRLAYEAGQPFLEEYLFKYSDRESAPDFNSRKKVTYCPAFARAAIEDIRASINERFGDISRTGGTSKSYISACNGLNGGVTRSGVNMNNFIGGVVLPELLSMGKVGVYIDMPSEVSPTLVDVQQPYVYCYQREDIKNWQYDPRTRQLIAVLLKDTNYKVDDETGLPVDDLEETYRFLRLTPTGVVAITFNSKGEQVQVANLNLRRIPFVIFDLGTSLMANICNYQIALLNLASSDISFAITSNFPFYVEQYDQGIEVSRMLQRQQYDDQNEPDPTAKPVGGDKAEPVGTNHGRRYSKGLEAPRFINPSSEPLEASMKKQEQLKTELRLLLNLTVSTLKPVRASAESKNADNKSLESGLSTIGAVLQVGEQEISEIWSQYENSKPVQIKYPVTYEVKSEADRLAEAKEYNEMMAKISSLTYQRTLAKQASTVLLRNKIDDETLDKIHSEIDSAISVISNPDDIRADVEVEILSRDTASSLRGYPEGEVEKAAKEHAERAARVVMAQTSPDKPAARGVPELDTNTTSGKDEKKDSRDTTLDPSTESKVRGEGK